ncbi:CHAT domain-containing tetratricopeptide repeat protein [Nodularia harveyana UHCC-0300]|uniref:CHAT domain-containing tetratricopeptide repeat protein n=1 Tax=Nodularia harveyana UHCC-0300 TaxID=2974287 RepID=A0ABU5UCR5_9CYAN|nr:CHAT domain-containing tetratricopeptide repeat protein [Nodularia harveyana]MEA5581318.1 CHAT domain-containing tetratricopeptide repeat protein [Nodularia harveyana UHCC-0300]
MDEQRLQAYQQLIQQLLSCANGEEPAILQANTELLDAGFLQVVVGVAGMFTQEGEENTANWLIALASQLSAALDIPLDANTSEAETPINEADIDTYLQFLLEVLQATKESGGNPQVVYPLLTANIDKLNLNFAQLLQAWATKILAEAEAEAELEKAQCFAVLIGEFSNLINEFPLGNKADNIEIAITGNEIALMFFTRNISPKIWASVQNHLGTAYCDRIRGDKAENLEKAITAFSAALEVRNHTDFPVDWAMTQNNLGTAYCDRIRGDKAENLEQAIAAYGEALEVRNQTDFPVDWAMTQNNLGTAYSDRIREDKAENLEKAITAFSAALEVYTPTNFPVTWASVQNNLGAAYSNRIRGDQSDNLEYAIAAYTAVLEVINRNDFPVDWAATQNNLGNAYSKKIRGDKADNLEQAIAAYTAALKVRTRTDFPVDWAATQNNLATAYSNRIRGDQADNLEYAIAAYTAALEVRNRTNFPQKNAETLLNLGIVYQESQQFDLAYSTFTDAIITVEDLRGEIISGEESKRKQAEEWNKLFRRMVEVCLALGRETEAITYIERSKTRNLVEQILSRDLKTIFPGEVVTQLEKLRDEIASGQNLLQTGKAENANLLRENLQNLRQESQKLQDQYLPIGASFEFTSLQNILDNKTAIIEWYITSDKIIAVVIQPGGQEVKIWQSQSKDRKALIDWVVEYLSDYYEQKEQWQNQLEQRLQNLPKILHIEEILEKIPPQCQKLILIPHQFLHLLPLHALPVRDSYLMDLFTEGVSYAPSCQLLQQAQLRQLDNFQSLFAIQTPTEDLYERDLGAVAAIKKQFNESNILKKDKAKKSAITSNNEKLLIANNLFFFCHGYFNPDSPLDSGLQLADEILSLADIITNLKLNNCRLVTLAACETGMIDPKNTSDEYIGLPNGFLLAGSTNVVSSLWTVSATATALLMVKFYEELQHQNNIVLALQTAQVWLRDTTIKEFRKWLRESNLDEDWQDELDDYFSREERNQGGNVKIFVSPFYWSAFCAIGKGV